MNSHEQYMRVAIEEALRAKESGEGKPFGSVVVRDGEIIAAARNETIRLQTPTAHAELTAIAAAAARLKTNTLAGCVIYASGQPCPMCLAAIHIAQIRTVYYANTYAQATAVGFHGGPMVRSLCSVFGAHGADVESFQSTDMLEIIHMPMPEAAALYTI